MSKTIQSRLIHLRPNHLFVAVSRRLGRTRARALPRNDLLFPVALKSSLLYSEAKLGCLRVGSGWEHVAMVTYNSQSCAPFSDLLCEAPGLRLTACPPDWVTITRTHFSRRLSQEGMWGVIPAQAKTHPLFGLGIFICKMEVFVVVTWKLRSEELSLPSETGPLSGLLPLARAQEDNLPVGSFPKTCMNCLQHDIGLPSFSYFYS